MKPGKQSSAQGKMKNVTTQTVAALTRQTINKIKARNPNRVHRGTKCTMHDMMSTGYGWLLPGWVAQERHMMSGRIYRHYYDPEGRLYKTQHEVVAAWEKCGLIVLDK